MIGNKRNYPAALVVPNFESLEKWAREKGIAYASREELIRKPEVVSFYQTRITGLLPEARAVRKIKRSPARHGVHGRVRSEPPPSR
jgi:long-chain acyl-CoA synthetase